MNEMLYSNSTIYIIKYTYSLPCQSDFYIKRLEKSWESGYSKVSLTTMGYGDIYPVSTIGRIVTMLSSFIGIAIVALPAGIITAGYMEELEK